MTKYRNAILASCAVGALAGGMSTASALPLPLAGTFGFAIYNIQTSTNGTSTAPSQQGNSANPLITPSDEVWAGSYTGALNFNTQSGSPAISTFLTSEGQTASQYTGSGAFTGVSISTLTQAISSKTFASTSLFVITGNVGGSANVQGAIVHDDGITLSDGAGTLINAPAPTTSETNAYTGLTGAFTLYYAEANGLPAVLDFTATPLPSTWTMLLGGLLGLGFLGYRRKDKAIALTASA